MHKGKQEEENTPIAEPSWPREGGRATSEINVVIGEEINRDNLAAAVSRSGRLIFTRLLGWGMFGVVFSWLPLGLDMLKELADDGKVDFPKVLSNGELFIISAVISAAAMGEIFAADFPSESKNGRLIWGGLCLLSCIADSAYYGFFDPSNSHGNTVLISLVMFGYAVAVSGVCIGMAAGR